MKTKENTRKSLKQTVFASLVKVSPFWLYPYFYYFLLPIHIRMIISGGNRIASFQLVMVKKLPKNIGSLGMNFKKYYP